MSDVLPEDSRSVSPDKVRTVGRAGYKFTDAAYDRRWLARVKAKTIVSEKGCWVWQGWVTKQGYGLTAHRRKAARVHRKTFEILHSVNLAFEQHVCHSCDVKLCCNPDHLWLGDNGANMLDLVNKGGHYWRNRTHCPKGHEYTPENTYVRPATAGQRAGSRSCKECQRIRVRDRYRSNPELMREQQRARRARSRGVSL